MATMPLDATGCLAGSRWTSCWRGCGDPLHAPLGARAASRQYTKQIERGGEIFVLEMGEPARIAEMARDLVRLSGLEPGRDIEIVYTGLRPGEKPKEELWTGTEGLEPTAQEKFLVIRRPEAEAASLSPFLGQMETLERLAKAGDVERLIPALRRVVPKCQPMPAGAGARDGHAALGFVGADALVMRRLTPCPVTHRPPVRGGARRTPRVDGSGGNPLDCA